MLLLYSPQVVVRPAEDARPVIAFLAASVILAIGVAVRDSRLKLPSPFFALALFSAAGLVALIRSEGAHNTQYFAFIVLFFYASIHLIVGFKVRAKKTDYREPEAVPAAPSSKWITGALVTALVVAVLFHAILNGYIFYAYVRTMIAPAFDFGIFAQSMEGIFHTGLPMNTLERSQEMSHFAVHFSPVLYLAWLLYAPVRSAEWLNVMQLLPVLLALLPLYKAMQLRGFSRNLSIIVMILYALSPAQIFSSHYGFHENAFLGLAVITMWYFWEKRSPLGMALGTVFVLFIKEDAFIYVVAFALWQMFSAYRARDVWRMKAAGIQMAGGLAYFVAVSAAMKHFGMGTMEASRFGNLITPGESGFVAVIKTIVASPAYAFSQIFLPDKMGYILLVLAITGFALLWVRDFELNWLLVPLVFVNLVGTWKYQWNISFQYHYGTSALLLIMLIVGIAGIQHSYSKLKAMRFAGSVLALALSVSVAFTGPHLVDSYKSYRQYMSAYTPRADQIRDYLDTLPKDATYLTSSSISVALYRSQSVYLAEPFWLQSATLPDHIMQGDFDYIIMNEKVLNDPADRLVFEQFISSFEELSEPSMPVDGLVVYENNSVSE